VGQRAVRWLEALLDAGVERQGAVDSSPPFVARVAVVSCYCCYHYYHHHDDEIVVAPAVAQCWPGLPGVRSRRHQSVLRLVDVVGVVAIVLVPKAGMGTLWSISEEALGGPPKNMVQQTLPTWKPVRAEEVLAFRNPWERRASFDCCCCWSGWMVVAVDDDERFPLVDPTCGGNFFFDTIVYFFR